MTPTQSDISARRVTATSLVREARHSYRQRPSSNISLLRNNVPEDSSRPDITADPAHHGRGDFNNDGKLDVAVATALALAFCLATARAASVRR